MIGQVRVVTGCIVKTGRDGVTKVHDRIVALKSGCSITQAAALKPDLNPFFVSDFEAVKYVTY